MTYKSPLEHNSILYFSIYLHLPVSLLAYTVVLLFSMFSFQPKEFSRISHKTGLMMINSLRFCLGNSLYILHIWRFAPYSFLSWQFFSFITSNISCCSLLACKTSVNKLTDGFLIGVHFYMRSCFFLWPLKNVITVCLSVDFFRSMLFGVLWA